MSLNYIYNYLALIQNYYTLLNYIYTNSALGLYLESPLYTLVDLLTKPTTLYRVDNNTTTL